MGQAARVDFSIDDTRIKARHYLESTRVISDNDMWYFVNQEETKVGPFSSREEAAEKLAHLLRYNATKDLFFAQF